MLLIYLFCLFFFALLIVSYNNQESNILLRNNIENEPDVNEDEGEIEAPKTGLSDRYLSFGYVIALGALLVIRKEQDN